MILSHARLPVPPQAHRCIIYQARPLPRLVRRSFPSRASYCASGLANCPLRAILRGSKIVLLYHYEPGFGPEARHRDYSFPLLRRLMKFLSQASDLSASTSGNHAPDGSVRFTLAELGEGDHPLTTQHRFGGPLDCPPSCSGADNQASAQYRRGHIRNSSESKGNRSRDWRLPRRRALRSFGDTPRM
jgi:hypothetical protein